VIKEVTAALEKYEIRDAALALEAFVDDLSRWYIRRSRRRLQKPESAADFKAASTTLRHVLLVLAKLIAPFTPFFAEALYADFGVGESVHFENWPEARKTKVDEKFLGAMAEVRTLASLVLAKRAELKLKVRQPLQKLTVKSAKLKPYKNLLEILKDEINVKNIVFSSSLEEEFVLDTEITPELKEEGDLRELMRMVQDLRQAAGLAPQDKIVLMAQSPEIIANFIKKNEAFFRKEVNAKMIEYKKSAKFGAEIETKFGEENIWLAVRKIK
jgi:isoleucyl-tRNA synthetase